MSKDKVISLAERFEDATKWSVEDMLLDALERVRSGEKANKKAIVLFLDDTEDRYLHGFSQAGMAMSECVLLCEMAKTMFKDEMGYE